ncbi:PAS domain S-box-containing protein/diguanylate cyclase (GGDEF)-like protein [Onishia taeanensis]|uniref:cyclic-guanylate-specific phosphodiesterase n=2 Tax=Oceanospirillales TaxID=135619 RepID=A0A328XPA8_9GAMM|nr:PAS domain S-box-containing protein/diguanylate cyclase (GGDEF)-like protein [Halomonas taeanensis]
MRQAGLLVLLITSLILALINILVVLLPQTALPHTITILPHIPMPPWRMASPLVSVLLLLLTLGLMGIVYHHGRWRAALHSRLSRRGGWLAVMLGGLSLTLWLWPADSDASSVLFTPLTLVSSLEVMLLGAALLLSAPVQGELLPPLSRTILIIAALGITLSIMVWWLVSGVLPRELPERAETLVGSLGLGAGLMGIGLTHQLIVSLSLMSIRSSQTRELYISEQRFRSLFTQNPDAVMSIDLDGVHRSINPAAEAVIGIDATALLGRSLEQVLTPEAVGRQALKRVVAAFEAVKGGQIQQYELQFTPPGQAPKGLDVRLLPIMVDDRVQGVYGIVEDITQRQRDMERLNVLERSIEASSNAVIITDATQPEHPVIYVNPAFTRITGYRDDQVLGRSGRFLEGPETDPMQAARIQASLDQGQELALTVLNYRSDGTPFWNQLFISPVRDAQGRATHFVGIMNDITERKDQEARLAYHASHDALTGLPNRALLNDRLQQGLALARRHGYVLAVLFIDLDEFKPINDTLGHEVGDQLLISVTRCLGRGLRPSDTLARLGGDEFVLVLPDLQESREASEVASRLLHELVAPHRVGGHELYLSASIGIAISHANSDATSDEQDGKLIQQADMAMYEAKQKGRNTYHQFSADLDSRLSQRLTLRNELQEAITQERLTLHYQPLLDADGRLDGLEALVRWQHPTKGAIPPCDFIPLAEETGQIIVLNQWVMARACRDVKELLARGLFNGRVSINLSPLEFHRANFLAGLKQTLEAAGLSPEHLELELTEGILMRSTDSAIERMNELQDLGVTTAIDDFGTGFSSLSYLRYLPIKKIKVDRSFVSNVSHNTKDAAICKGIITLAKELELKVVAEGVETQAQLDYLKEQRCDLYQGYLLARPMPLERLMPWLSERTGSA